MSDRIDHAAEARQHIEWAHDWQAREGDTPETGIATALIAIAESNLALVEQQRIQNLIALHRHEVEYDINEGRSLLFETGTEALRSDIAAVLGIEEVQS